MKQTKNKKPKVTYGKPPAELTRMQFGGSGFTNSSSKPHTAGPKIERSGHRGDR